MIQITNFIPGRNQAFDSVQEAIVNIRKKLISVGKYSVGKALSDMRFDPVYTKPANFSGYAIVGNLIEINERVSIYPYTQNYFAWKFCPVNGYVNPDEPLVIHLNTRQYRTAQEWEETIWHELIHVSDAFSTASFGHGDNNLEGKDETAPVKIARAMAFYSVSENA